MTISPATVISQTVSTDLCRLPRTGRTFIIYEIFMTSWRHCKPHHSSCLLETHCRTTQTELPATVHATAMQYQNTDYCTDNINFNNMWRYYHTHTHQVAVKSLHLKKKKNPLKFPSVVQHEHSMHNSYTHTHKNNNETKLQLSVTHTVQESLHIIVLQYKVCLCFSNPQFNKRNVKLLLFKTSHG